MIKNPVHKYMIIANPAAGNGAGSRAIPKIQRLLTSLGLDFDMVISERPGHGIELARQAALGGWDVVVAAGGDGTANEVINGLMAAQEQGAPPIAMGMLGIGRGNDFGDTMGVPGDLEAACQFLAADGRHQIDLGRVTGGHYPQGRYFGNCVGVGFDAIATIEADKLPLLGGFLSFLVAVLKTMIFYHKAPVSTVHYDGQSLTQPSLMISITNGRRLGGGFIMSPGAKPDDGLFDLCIAHETSRLRIIRLIPHFLRGTQAGQKEIITGRAAHITITGADSPLPAQVDGEILSTDGRWLEIELLPRRLEIIGRS